MGLCWAVPSSVDRSTALVTPEWLHDRLRVQSAKKGARLKIVDARLGTADQTALQSFREDHIPGAVFFDLEECRDKSSTCGLTLPSQKQFEEYVGKLGITPKDHLVIYDHSDLGAFSAFRVWWYFKVYGHKRVSVLDGGMKNWTEAGYNTTGGLEAVSPKVYRAKFCSHLVKNFGDMQRNLINGNDLVVDARLSGRFYGTKPEPLPNVKPGRIPGAVNLPFKKMFKAEGRGMMSQEAMKHHFAMAGVTFLRPIVFSCGTGMTACVLAFSAYLLGHECPIYDGSWTEWYQRARPDQMVGVPQSDPDAAH